MWNAKDSYLHFGGWECIGRFGLFFKGMKMELVTMKNTLVKTNQKRAEYVAVIEEKMQMEKLGIDEDAL